MPNADPLIQIKPTDSEARVFIDCNRKADKPINRNLFGKFTEHLGRNIYNGMWAQILENTSFADWSFFSQVWTPDADRLKDPDIERHRSAYEKGIAYRWLPCGSEDATYLIDWLNPYNSCTSQKITVPGSEAGIRQSIYLPAHRTLGYTASFYARGQAESIRISLAKASSGQVLEEADVTGLTDDWSAYTADLQLPADSLERGEPVEFRISLPNRGQVWIDQVFLFPDDHLSGFDPDVIRMLKESRLPLLRYPGGNFVSGYHWRDGIGPLERRPVLPNPAWPIIEPNHVGTDEFIDFCRAVGCEPLICVNAGNGTPQEAADWVEYCNGGTDTPNGALRAEYGHPEPHNIRYWEIGNELYGRWQIGHCTPEEYAERYEAFHAAMLRVDPELLIIANGQSLEWNKPLVKRKGKIVRSLSLHTLTGGGARREKDAEAVYLSLMGYIASYDDKLEELKAQAAPYNPDVKIAVTEHQIMCGVPHLPTNATQAESLYLSGALHSAMRQGDLVEMFTHSALVNHGGGLKKEREIVYPAPVHWVSYLYGNLPEATLVHSLTSSPTFTANIKSIMTESNLPYIDALAAVSDNGLIILAQNRHPTEEIEITCELSNFDPANTAELQTIAGESYMSRNDRNSPNEVAIDMREIPIGGSNFKISLSPHSVNAVMINQA